MTIRNAIRNDSTSRREYPVIIKPPRIAPRVCLALSSEPYLWRQPFRLYILDLPFTMSLTSKCVKGRSLDL